MTALDEKPTKLTHTELRILCVLLRDEEWQADYGNYWLGFRELAARVNRPLNDVRAAVHRMKNLGMLYHSQMVDDDLQVCGSGYFVTDYRGRFGYGFGGCQ